MKTLKNKIEELNKKLENPNLPEMRIEDLELRLQAYQEAQKLFDENLKNIIDEIEELDCNCFDCCDDNLRDKPNCPYGEITKENVKQIIQKQFNSQERAVGNSSQTNTNKKLGKGLISKNPETSPDTSILDDFCKGIKRKNKN